MARSVAERYLVAAFAFVAAAAWLGVGLVHGLACLLVFVLALLAVRLYQHRSESRGRGGTSKRERRPRPRYSADERVARRPRARSVARAPHGRPYDSETEPGERVVSESAW